MEDNCDRKPHFKNKCNQVGCEIHRLEHLMSKNREIRVKEAGIDEVTMMHGWILRFLYDNRSEDVYQKDIEKFFHIGRSTVTNTIQIMEKRGMVRRESVEWDARLKKVLLTEKGIETHKAMEALIEEMDQGILDGIDEEDTDTFLKVLYQIRENVEKKEMRKRKGEFHDPDFVERSEGV